jgi:Asp-tRNA(Asn)/Glu-tRNA(Gln) amidotransferase A subunit family amidase
LSPGRAHATELADAAIARIDRLNPQLNCVIFLRYEKARRGARSAQSAPAERFAAFLF